jgi:hypothetical protein
MSILSVCLWLHPIYFWIPEPILMKIGMYIMATEPVSTAYFINLSYQSMCLYVYPLLLLGNGSVNVTTNTQATI